MDLPWGTCLARHTQIADQTDDPQKAARGAAACRNAVSGGRPSWAVGGQPARPATSMNRLDASALRV
jgi:hypothetical protein